MSENTRHIVEQLRARVRMAGRRILLSELLLGLIIVTAGAAGIWSLLVVAEMTLWMSVAARTILVGSFVLVTMLALGVLVIPPAARLLVPRFEPTAEAIAHRIAPRFPGAGDRLESAFDLASGRSSRAPDLLLDRAIGMLATDLAPVPIERAEDFSRPRRAAVMSAWAPVLLLVVFGAAPDGFRDASSRLIAYATPFEPPAPFSLSVDPGDAERARGEALEIRVRASGTALPSGATIQFIEDGSEFVEHVDLASTARGEFTHRIESVRQAMRYRVMADEVASPWFDVSLVDRPFVRGLTIDTEYPAYTGLPATRTTGHRGDVRALRGSTVRVTSETAGPPLARAVIELSTGETIDMHVDGQTVSAAFVLTEAANYRLVLEGANGSSNPDPIRHEIEVIDDAPPTVSIVSPEPDAVLAEDLETTVLARLADDYGFSRLVLSYRRVESRYRPADDSYRTAALPLDTPRPREQDVAFLWRLGDSDLDPLPGDVIEYFLDVWDNDAVSGAKRARSAVHRLRIPSLADRYRQTDQRQSEMRDGMERLIEDARDFKRQFEQVRDEIRSRQEADWQSRQQLDALEQRQADMQQRADELAREMQALTREMERNDMISPETLETYRELQRVIEEINSPELLEALKNLQEALQELDLGQVQEQMQNLEFNEQQYQQRLERTLELFKRARAIQQLEQAERMAAELARQQEQIREQTEGLNQTTSQDGDASREDQTPATGDRDQLSQDQSRLGDEMRDFEDSLQDLGEQLREVRRGEEQLDQIREDLRKQQLPEKMQQAADQIRNDQSGDARQNQQSAQEQLDQLQQQLSDMRSGMQGAQMNLNLSGLRRTLRDIIQLSRDQEGMQHATVQQGAGSPGLRDMARGQMRLAEGVGVVADSLQSLAGQIPQMTRDVQQHTGDALREMQRATEALVDRSAREASTRQRSSMMHLNELALMLSDLLDQLMSQQSGGSEGGMSIDDMADQLQQMSEQQRSLNRQIQDFLNETQGDRMSVDQQERLRQMAAQQDEIRRQLRQLGRESIARETMLNELNRIAEQMSETIRELQQRGASRQTIERQQQILTRLLEAQNSLQQRGEDEQRRGRSGEQQQRMSPPEIERQREIETLRRDLIRALESDYAQDYQELIRRYFELLRREVQPGD